MWTEIRIEGTNRTAGDSFLCLNSSKLGEKHLKIVLYSTAQLQGNVYLATKFEENTHVYSPAFVERETKYG